MDDKKNKVKVTDIIRRGAAPGSSAGQKAKEQKEKVEKEKKKHKESDIAHVKNAEKELAVIKAEVSHIAHDSHEIEEKLEGLEEEESARFKKEKEVIRRRRFTALNAILILIAILALGGLAYSLIELLPRVRIDLVLAKHEWSYNDSVVAEKNVSAIDAAGKIIPGQIFETRRNFTFSYPASGKRQVVKKARGRIAIVNNYSSAPQTLVAQTRFADQGGRVFYLDRRVVVPGAQIKEGKIVSSSVEAGVTAEKAGAEYNISESRFTIPGFKGTPKFQGFYAESKSAIAGGLIGEEAYPTPDDISKARARATEEIKNKLDSFLALQIPQAFKIIDGSKQFKVIKDSIAEEMDDKGNFGFYIEAQDSVMVFKESDVLALMAELARKGLEKNNLEAKEYSLEYGGARLDPAQGKFTFTVKYGGKLWEPVRNTSLVENLKGKKEEEVKNIIYAIPGRERAAITFWPFWVKTAPENPDRIAVEVR